ncbi:MAG: pilus assembly protein [Candidatus Eremiobacteraeota bacterium]|nr:pilus assembly protein [Candidatus Eremiobacteraeota bacterium]
MTARHRERGASLPETAIVMAVVLAILFGIIDFGRALYTYSFVATLAREGARWAIVRGANCTMLPAPCPARSGSADIQPYVRSLSQGVTNPNLITANLSFPCNTPGCVAQVTVQYPFSFSLPFMPKTGISMSSTSQMVISN